MIIIERIWVELLKQKTENIDEQNIKVKQRKSKTKEKTFFF